MQGWNGTVEIVDPAKIIVDHRYQRPRYEHLIAEIAAAPNPLLFGVPVCVKLAGVNGIYYCVDGQQRLAGLLASEKPPREIIVLVVATVSLRDEAEIFVLINEWRKQLSPIERHTGRVVAEHPEALAVARAIETAGLAVSKSPSSRSFGAISAAYEILRVGGEECLLQTLIVARDAWPDDKKGLDRNLIRVIGQIINTQNGGYNRQKLTAALAKTTPAAIFRKAEEIHFDQGVGRLDSIRRAIKALAKV